MDFATFMGGLIVIGPFMGFFVLMAVSLLTRKDGKIL